MRRVHLHIDSLVLHGVAFEERRAVAAAIERELTRRLSISDVSSLETLGHVDRLPAARAEAASRKPVDIGRAAAHGIVGALAPGKNGR